MIEVEIVVAGGLGEVALSMMPELAAERRMLTRLIVADQAGVAVVMSRLERRGLEVLRVAELGASGSGTADG
jgi:hypothetical protein